MVGRESGEVEKKKFEDNDGKDSKGEKDCNQL